jgi:hypothetical protein
MVACRVGCHGLEIVHVDPHVVAINVKELGAEDGVELDGKDVVAGLAVVVDVEEPQVLCSDGAREVLAGCDHKGEAVIAQLSVLGDDAKHGSSRERHDTTAVLYADLCRWRGVGKKAWPLVTLSVVRASRPAGVIAAAPYKVRFAPAKPSMVNCLSLADDTISWSLWRTTRMKEMDLTLTIANMTRERGKFWFWRGW